MHCYLLISHQDVPLAAPSWKPNDAEACRGRSWSESRAWHTWSSGPLRGGCFGSSGPQPGRQQSAWDMSLSGYNRHFSSCQLLAGQELLPQPAVCLHTFTSACYPLCAVAEAFPQPTILAQRLTSCNISH